MKKRFLSAVLLSGVSLGTSTAVQAEDYESKIAIKEDVIANLTSQQIQAQTQVTSLQGQVSHLASQQAQLEVENQVLEAKSFQLSEEIQQLSDKIVVRNENLKKQARKAQKQHVSRNYITTLVNSKSLSDAITKVMAIHEMVSANQSMIEQQENDKALLAEKQKVNQESINTVAQNQAILTANKASLETQKSQLEVAQINLSMELSTAQEERDNLIVEKSTAESVAASVSTSESVASSVLASESAAAIEAAASASALASETAISLAASTSASLAVVESESASVAEQSVASESALTSASASASAQSQASSEVVVPTVSEVASVVASEASLVSETPLVSEVAPLVSEAPAPVTRAVEPVVAAPTPVKATPVASNVAGNTYPIGQCTWGVKSLAPWAGNNWGNGGQWAASAAAEGFSVGTTPVVGSIAVWNDGGYGHVAYVTGVQSATSIQVMEANFNGNQSIANHRGWFNPTATYQGAAVYIYPN